jgi:hypothetical protein
MKTKIKIPLFGLNDNQKITQLKQMNDNYYNKFDFVESNDDLIHFDIIDNNDNIFAVIININGESRQKAENKCYNIIEKYKIYTDCEFVFLPNYIQENQIIKLSNTNKIVELLH